MRSRLHVLWAASVIHAGTSGGFRPSVAVWKCQWQILFLILQLFVNGYYLHVLNTQALFLARWECLRSSDWLAACGEVSDWPIDDHQVLTGWIRKPMGNIYKTLWCGGAQQIQSHHLILHQQKICYLMVSIDKTLLIQIIVRLLMLDILDMMLWLLRKVRTEYLVTELVLLVVNTG